MTMLPQTPAKKLGLVIDLDICVGCHACAVNCRNGIQAAMAIRYLTRIPMVQNQAVPG